jgi:hypothetical protein
MSNDRYFGKFRGVVANNTDPQNRGRLQVTITNFSNDALYWAEACVPYLASLEYPMPQVGMNVWVEFEQGDPGYPIWVGCMWDGSFNAY